MIVGYVHYAVTLLRNPTKLKLEGNSKQSAVLSIHYMYVQKQESNHILTSKIRNKTTFPLPHT